MTLLFCDVTGSTALGERLDPESLRAVMARYFDAARLVIERHGGTVEKFIGDAVMAVFGIPVLHEDDALRAVRAAAELRDGLEKLNEDLMREYGTTLELRIGVNTGEVVTGTQERLATGDAVNVTARLEQAAQPGEILIGAETRVLVGDAVVVEAVDSMELKGKAAPVIAYRLVAVRSEPPSRRHSGAMVGRARELGRLQAALAQAEADRSCHLFTVLGAAGVGKSRLAYEFLTALDGATVVRGMLSLVRGGDHLLARRRGAQAAARFGAGAAPRRPRAGSVRFAGDSGCARRRWRGGLGRGDRMGDAGAAGRVRRDRAARRRVG